MNNSMKNSGLHGNSDKTTRGPTSADVSPGKRTLTESIASPGFAGARSTPGGSAESIDAGPAPALSADSSAQPASFVQRKAPPLASPALSAFSVGAVASSFASTGGE